MRSILIAVLSTILLSTAARSQLRRPDRRGECGPPSTGVALCLSRSSDLNAVIELRNTSKEDKVLNLGIMLANGARQHASALTFTLMDKDGKEHHAVLSQPAGVIAGRLDPLVLPLPAGGAFRLPVYLSQCLWHSANGDLEEFKPDPNQPYKLQAQFSGKKVEGNSDAALMPYWTGEITSNSLSVGRN